MRRKKTKKITLHLVPYVAAAVLSSCSGAPDTTQICVDEAGKVLPSSECEKKDRDRLHSTAGHYHASGWPSWYYLSGGNRNVPLGSRMPESGSFMEPKGGISHINGTSNTVSRGFFGRIGGGHFHGG